MRLSLLLISLFFLNVACKTDGKAPSNPSESARASETVFDHEKWRVKEGRSYPYREQMLNEVVYSDTIRSLSKVELLKLLGEPDRSQEGHLYYTITKTRLGFWTLHRKTMVVKLSDNDTIDWIKSHE
ncbi:hypothetical protein FK220_016010 [Flavobacteriaceae bacterium TP-CH-4]|uniref:Uncharacterized protein n=1 Tax=Pelagihabitans pacificus TaxID=2696054 RepID=A0A967AWX4_9FLAO|nr:hypothetical protein [Pelagihabitans pacificus]NHF60860.1 hypothetical protein [Pelagihabitans pacificus]